MQDADRAGSIELTSQMEPHRGGAGDSGRQRATAGGLAAAFTSLPLLVRLGREVSHKTEDDISTWRWGVGGRGQGGHFLHP